MTKEQEIEALRLELELRNRVQQQFDAEKTPAATGLLRTLANAAGVGYGNQKTAPSKNPAAAVIPLSSDFAPVARTVPPILALAGGQPQLVPGMAAAGEYLGSKLEGSTPTMGRTLGAAVANSFLPGEGGFLKTAGGYALGNLAGKNTQTFIDEGRPASLKEDAVAAALGLPSAVLGKFLGNKQSQTFKEAVGTDALRRETIKIGRELGYVLPPSVASKHGAKSSEAANVIDSIGGKAAIAQEATHMNQPITNFRVREELGIPQVKAISEETLADAAKPWNAVYEEAGKISPQAAVALKEFKQANADSNSLFAQYRNAIVKDPSLLQKAKDFRKDADFYLKEIGLEGLANGKSDIVPRLQEARMKLAQINLVRESTRMSTGDVDASMLGAAYDAGQPLSGNLEKIGRFQNAFAQSMREAANTPVPGVNQLARGVLPFAAGGAAQVGGLGGPASLAITAATMFAPQAARNLAMSRFYQNNLTSPSYPNPIPAETNQFLRVLTPYDTNSATR